MDNLRCSDCKYKEDFTPSGCEKCNTCDWCLGISAQYYCDADIKESYTFIYPNNNKED